MPQMQWLLWGIFVVIALLAASPLGRIVFHFGGKVIDRLAARPAVAITFVGIFAGCTAATLALLTSIPEPQFHDEFSYLLAADTFAHGRLANPPHSMWQHFETMHVLHRPTYASKYAPAQGLFLAMGILTLDHAIAGVWVSIALAAAAVTWMLYAWVSPRWAVAAGLLIALHPQMLSWGQSYWGGAVPLVGAALVLGAVRRLIDRPTGQTASGLLLALGLAVLANSRTYEGLLLAIVIAIPLLMWTVKSQQFRWLIPAVSVGVVALGFMAYYNYRVTGWATQSPYALHDETYTMTPHFIFQDLRPPREYRHADLAYFHTEWETAHWRRQQTFRGWLGDVGRKMSEMGRIFFNPLILIVPLVALPRAFRDDRWTRLALVIVVVVALGQLIITWPFLPHYFAPALAGLACILAISIQRLQDFKWRNRSIGPMLVRITLALVIAQAALSMLSLAAARKVSWSNQRQELINRLRESGGKHLVVVRYLPGHPIHQEWVYNAADIDNATVVWARDYNDDLVASHFRKTRKVWILEIGPGVRTLTPYMPRLINVYQNHQTSGRSR
jgi:hypothetical protein